MNDVEKAIRIYDIPENRKTCFNNENMTISIMEKVVTNYVEKMEDHVCESIIKCLPDDVTKVLFLDKDKITEIFKKRISKRPIGNDNGNYAEYFESWLECPKCGEAIPEYTAENNTWCYCLGCGQKLDWSEVENED